MSDKVRTSVSVSREVRRELRYLKAEQDAASYDEVLRSKLEIDDST